MRLSEMVDTDLLEQHVAAKLVRVQTHPSRPWRIYNYTETCQWTRAWDAVTVACRGLVVDEDDTVLARPFPKFFNHGEPGAADIDLADRVVVMDKVDGSLGILLPDGSIATRGSFASEQADHATDLYRTRYDRAWTPEPGLTYLFEIVYPENRIVVDYGPLSDLILLGAIDIKTGRTLHPWEARADWPGPVVEVFDHATLHEALSAPDRANAEGFVIWRPADDARIKIKQEDYKRLHRLVTQVTPRHVWECLAAGLDPDVEFAGAPDEFHTWLVVEVELLRNRFGLLAEDIADAYAQITATGPADRKAFAAAAVQSPYRAALFRLYDGKPIDELIWKQIRPESARTLRLVSSDAD